jgi:hypothetical protein
MYFKFNWANIKYINKRAWRDSSSVRRRHTERKRSTKENRTLRVDLSARRFLYAPPKGGCVCAVVVEYNVLIDL